MLVYCYDLSEGSTYVADDPDEHFFFYSQLLGSKKCNDWNESACLVQNDKFSYNTSFAILLHYNNTSWDE